MVCRHSSGDSSCSSSTAGRARAEREAADYRSRKEKKERRKKERDALTPDADNYEIRKFERVKNYVVMQILYPNCKLCAYDGVKTMVFERLTEMQMIQMKRIDPHFRPTDERVIGEAPSPIARFPGSDKGWGFALNWVKSLK